MSFANMSIGVTVTATVVSLFLKTTIPWLVPPPVLIEGVGTAPAEVRAGERYIFKWVIDKNTDCGGETSRAWFGASNFQLTEATQKTVLPRGRITPNIETDIPDLAPERDLSLYIVGHFDCRDGRHEFKLGPVQTKVVK